MVTVVSTFVQKMSLTEAHPYVKAQNGKGKIDHSQRIFLYHKGNGRS